MGFGRKFVTATLATFVLSSAAVVPSATSLAFETGLAPAVTATATPLPQATGFVLDGDTYRFAPAEAETELAVATDAEMGIDEELICLVKVVLHEAGNQSRDGQLAVAQVVMNRVASPLFPDTICGVVMQRGQFFNVHAYNPRRDARWETAVEVALDARNKMSAQVVGDAIFFHAAYAQPSFHRSRERVTQLGDHVFYR